MRVSTRRLLLAVLAALVFTACAEDDAANAPATEAQQEEQESVVVASILVDLPSNDDYDDDADAAEEEGADGAAADKVKSPPPKQRGKAYVYSGEDAAIGAFRFAEHYGSRYPLNSIPSDTVVDVARQLQEKLDSSKEGGSSNYTPPNDITHCGKRQCTAGKLWKRSEEMRRADVHDAAGSDLIRALLKTGIEIDFRLKCHQSLQWALGSIRRQREREKREALEEEKAEKRRVEEREAMAEAEVRRMEYEGNFVKFGERLQLELSQSGDDGGGGDKAAEATIDADGQTEVDVANTEHLIRSVKDTFTSSGPQGGNYTETLALLKKIPLSDKSVDVLLIEARCHELLGNHKSALSAAGKLISKAANHDPWINDTPRMMAATLGANAAMQLGLSENALSFYQTVLKFDPEQDRARTQYRGLKKVVKLLGKADEQIQKGYNNKASEIVDDCLSAMRGLDVDSPLFRSKIQLKQCTILSGQGKYEEALEHCDVAVELRAGNDAVSPESQKEAYLVRAEALLSDLDYDEAVNDFRSAFDLVPEPTKDDDTREEKGQLQHKLRQAMHQQDLWNGGQKDMRYNENTGYPDGRPPQRDHAKILQLPIDLEERSKEIKCAWLKKQFKALVRKYHPDKYKGNKKRAARKFKEVKEAKEIISSAWDC